MQGATALPRSQHESIRSIRAWSLWLSLSLWLPAPSAPPAALPLLDTAAPSETCRRSQDGPLHRTTLHRRQSCPPLPAPAPCRSSDSGQCAQLRLQLRFRLLRQRQQQAPGRPQPALPPQLLPGLVAAHWRRRRRRWYRDRRLTGKGSLGRTAARRWVDCHVRLRMLSPSHHQHGGALKWQSHATKWGSRTALSTGHRSLAVKRGRRRRSLTPASAQRTRHLGKVSGLTQAGPKKHRPRYRHR
mmetsp:Transcript_3557/g.14789  ORF Transcript_3557/g.14789 Transcript_3557/m.14789 type:complete len:243 (-) Transcript_3557:104-832(-)